MWFDKLELALLLRQECFDVLSGLIVHDVYLGLVPLRGEVIELYLVCSENAFIVKARNRGCQYYCIQLVMMHYKNTYALV